MLKKLKGFVPVRHNKNANGFCYTDARRKQLTGKSRPFMLNNEHHNTMGKLNLYGTCDPLARGLSFYLSGKVQKHPTDYGYSKTVFVLNDAGKRKLKNMRTEAMYKINNVASSKNKPY